MDEILEYYAAGVEEQRLQRGIGRLELARTQELLLRLLPPPPAVVYDVGGGTGVYSFWLAGLDYTVHLFELSPANVAAALQRNARPGEPRLAGIHHADGRSLGCAPESAGAVMVMGPLYHLTRRNERIRALSEAWRALKPGGRLVAAAISHYGSTLYGLSTYGYVNELLGEPEFLAMCEQELASGQHIRPQKYPRLIARAFFHLPRELLAEAAEAGFKDAEIYAVEGPGWIMPNFDEAWQDAARRETILRVVRGIERDPDILGVSPHLLATAVKPV
jgi:SAM-dependent methyltransferase